MIAFDQIGSYNAAFVPGNWSQRRPAACSSITLPGGKQVPFCAYNTIGYREQARKHLEAKYYSKFNVAVVVQLT